MNWHRLGKLALVGISTFAVIAFAAFIYIRLFGPFVTIHRLVAFIGTIFAVSGAVVAVVVVWAASRPGR